MQLVLLFENGKVKRYNVTSDCEDPDRLDVTTSGATHWLVTPSGAALLALRHVAPSLPIGASGSPANGTGYTGWALDAYALEECMPEQALFQQIADGLPLPADMAALPAMVRAAACLFACATVAAPHCLP